MKIVLNGDIKEIKSSENNQSSIQDLINELNIKKETVVAELDGKIIESKVFDKTMLYENARLELIRFVGGG